MVCTPAATGKSSEASLEVSAPSEAACKAKGNGYVLDPVNPLRCTCDTSKIFLFSILNDRNDKPIL